jgi:hypothetical protein
MKDRLGLLALGAVLLATLAYAQDTDTSVLKLPQVLSSKGL